MFKIEYYEKADKTKPVEEFILSLNDKLRVKVLRDLKLLQEFGNELREPQSVYIHDGIFELRSKVSTNIIRVFYFFIVGKTVVLTNGYIKKQQKLSNRDLKIAIKYKTDYMNLSLIHI